MPLYEVLDDEVVARVSALDIPFNAYGLDPYGISRDYLAAFFTGLKWFYRVYFRVQSHHIHHVPAEGRGLVVGNHSGGIPVDGGMVLASVFLDRDPPRLLHGMVEKFANRWPYLSQLYSRFGQFTGLPEHAVRLLSDERLVMAFPEGVRGIGKLYSDRYKLVRFGTGFMRLALQTKSPIIPCGFVGGEEAFPVMMRLDRIGKLIGAPFIPIPKHIVPLPKPVVCHIVYGEPMYFEGNGSEADDIIEGYVEQVKAAIDALIREGKTLSQSDPNEIGSTELGE